MRKTLKRRSLNERTALALSLVVLLAALGCTTNRNPGSGEPYIGTPGLRPTGTISFLKAPDLPPPMTSSYTGSEALPVVKARSSNLPLTADQAAAVLRQQTPRVRVLGQSSPGVTGGYFSDGIVTGLPQNSAAMTNPQSTINSSLTSTPVQAVTSGVGSGGGGTAVINASGVTANSTTAGLSATADGAAVFSNSGIVTPTTAAIPLSPGAFAAGGTPARSTSTRTTRVAATPVTASSAVSSGAVRVVTMDGRVVVTNSNQ